MKNFIACTASFIALTTGAVAGSPEPATAPVVMPAVATTTSDWGGFYAGLSAGQASGFQEYTGISEYDLSGDVKGAFAGYNFDMNPYIVGVELAYAKGPVIEEEIGGTGTYPDYNFKNFVDIKGRAGYTFGDMLVYAVLGFSSGVWDENGTTQRANGLAYGAGVDYMVTPKLFVGAEFLKRDLSTSDGLPSYFDADVDSWQLRVGYKF